LGGLVGGLERLPLPGPVRGRTSEPVSGLRPRVRDERFCGDLPEGIAAALVAGLVADLIAGLPVGLLEGLRAGLGEGLGLGIVSKGIRVERGGEMNRSALAKLERMPRRLPRSADRDIEHQPCHQPHRDQA